MFCVRWSGDGRELITGASDANLYVIDATVNKRVACFQAHDDDVNSVCFIDPADSNVVCSASDDCTIKIWDRRAIRKSNVPSGVLLGHTEGLTYISPKGDGRHLLSNGKDQKMKLWDIRKLVAYDSEAYKNRLDYRPSFDYRWETPHPDIRESVCPNDCSLQTFTGHAVLKTLSRCYFSPVATTGQRYAYTGSADGIVRIFDLNNPKTEPREIDCRGGRNAGVLIRDLSWNPYDPKMIIGTCEPHAVLTVEQKFGSKPLGNLWKRPLGFPQGFRFESRVGFTQAELEALIEQYEDRGVLTDDEESDF